MSDASKSIRSQVKRVVVWGHKLHTDTFSYVNYGFVKAFASVGFDTKWLGNDDDVSGEDFAGTLFFTMNTADMKIPKRADCFYVLHNCSVAAYCAAGIPKKHILALQVFCIGARNAPTLPGQSSEYVRYSNGGLYQSWGTDLLPEEITKNIANIDSILAKSTGSKKVVIVAHLTEEWKNASDHIKKIGHVLEFRTASTKKPTSSDDNIVMVQESATAPTIQTQWQIENHYLPCRAFKNISYGRMTGTNSKTTAEVFGDRIVYSPTIEGTIDELIKYEKKPIGDRRREIVELMEEVRDKHTYISKINNIFAAFDLWVADC